LDSGFALSRAPESKQRDKTLRLDSGFAPVGRAPE